MNPFSDTMSCIYELTSEQEGSCVITSEPLENSNWRTCRRSDSERTLKVCSLISGSQLLGVAALAFTILAVLTLAGSPLIQKCAKMCVSVGGAEASQMSIKASP